MLDVVARASTPWERASCAAFALCPGGDDPALLQRREAAWAAAIVGGDRVALHAHLAWRGVPESTFRRALCDVRVVDPAALPDWASDALDLFEPALDDGGALPRMTVRDIARGAEIDQVGKDGGAPWGLQPLFDPLLRLATRQLDDMLARRPLALAPAVRRQVLADLIRSWLGVLLPLLLHQIGPADLLAEHPPGRLGASVMTACFGESGPRIPQWRRLLRSYPVVARLLAVALRDWREGTAELLDRILADAHLLEQRFGAGRRLGALEAYAPGAGDRHARGRTVAILTFASGLRVVYKPKDLRIAVAYGSLVSWLNAAGLELPLHARTVVQRAGYAWEEFVSPRPCATTAEVRRFYRRLGMHARLLQLLDACDFTTDNVVACGEHPVLVDLESVVAPRAAPAPDLAQAEAAGNRRTADFPLRSGVLTAKVVGRPGYPAAELGALGCGTRLAPFPLTLVQSDAGGRPVLVSGQTAFTVNCAVPRHRGRAVRPADHFADVVDGYDAMAELLRALAPHLQADDGPLAAFADTCARFLARDTHVYGRLLEDSMRPRRLADGFERELCLERLWRARFADPAVVAHEIEALRNLDVPLFSARLDGEALQVGAGRETTGVLDGSPMRALRARAAALPHTRPEQEEDTVRVVLYTTEPEARPRRRRVAPDRPRACSGRRGSSGSWAERAVALGDGILETADVGRDNTLEWFGLDYLAEHGTWRLGRLGDSLLTGVAGLSVVFADLYRLSELERFGTAAQRLAERLAVGLAALAERPGSSPTGWGAFQGCGGAMYAVQRVARALGGIPALQHAADAAEALPFETACASASADLVTGRAGLVLGLLALAERAGCPALARRARALAVELSARERGGAERRVLVPGPMLDLLPDIEDGIRLAVARAAPGAEPAGGVRPGRPESGRAPAGSGAALGRLALVAAGAVAREAALAQARAAAAAGARKRSPRMQLEAAELSITLFQMDGLPADYARAERLARALCRERDASGRWFSDRWAPDRYLPSGVVGQGALVSLFARLARPEAISSLRLLA